MKLSDLQQFGNCGDAIMSMFPNEKNVRQTFADFNVKNLALVDGLMPQAWLDLVSTGILARVASTSSQMKRGTRTLALAVHAAELKISSQVKSYFKRIVGAKDQPARDAWAMVTKIAEERVAIVGEEVAVESMAKWMKVLEDACNEDDVVNVYNNAVDVLDDLKEITAVAVMYVDRDPSISCDTEDGSFSDTALRLRKLLIRTFERLPSCQTL